jgi:hypothetical protein
MKILLLLLVFSAASFAGQKCTKDYFGNYTCYGTGQDYGYRSSEQKDYFGNSTWTDNKGNRTKCTYDYLGNYSCN